MIAIVAIAAAAALAQAYQSEKARGANAAKLKQMEREFSQLIPPEYDMSIMDPPQMIKEAVPSPDYDLKTLTPEQYKVVAKYTPEVAPYVAEQRPDIIKQTAAAEEGRSAQVDALRKMRGIASSDFDPELAATLSKASRQAQIDSQSRSQSILSDFQRRGAANSGLAASLQQQASAEAMDRQAGLGQDAAAESYRNRLQAIRDSARMGGEINQSENSLAAQNAAIINSFNQRMAAGRQDWENQRVGDANMAQRQNIAADQSTANMNVENKNKYALGERARMDDIQRDLYNRRSSERDYINRMRQGEAEWQRGERDTRNQQLAKGFDDKYRIAAGKQGLAVQGMQMNNQTAADRNQQIQGLVNAGTNAYMYDQDMDTRQQDLAERRKDREWQQQQWKDSQNG